MERWMRQAQYHEQLAKRAATCTMQTWRVLARPSLRWRCLAWQYKDIMLKRDSDEGS